MDTYAINRQADLCRIRNHEEMLASNTLLTGEQMTRSDRRIVSRTIDHMRGMFWLLCADEMSREISACLSRIGVISRPPGVPESAKFLGECNGVQWWHCANIHYLCVYEGVYEVYGYDGQVCFNWYAHGRKVHNLSSRNWETGEGGYRCKCGLAN